MGEGPKDMRDDAGRRFDTPPSDDVMGRRDEEIAGRSAVGPDTSAPIPGAYPLGAVPTGSTVGSRETFDTSVTPDDRTSAAERTEGGTPETAEIRAEIEQKRADISETIDEIQQRLSPGNLVSQATDSMRDATKQGARRVAERASETAGQVAARTRDAADTVAYQVREHPWSAAAVLAGIGAATWWMMSRRSSGVEDWDVDDYTEESLYYDDELTASGENRVMNAIRENPVPIALTTLGIGWLVWNQRSGRRSSFGSSYPASTFDSSYASRSGYGAAGADAGTYRTFDSDRGIWTGGETGEAMKGAVSNATERAREAVDDMTDRTRDMANRAQHQLGEAGRRARTQLQYWMDRNPLAVGAVAMAVGAAVGLALPETQREHALMGNARDRLVDRAQEMANNAVEKAGETIGEAADRAMDTSGSETPRS